MTADHATDEDLLRAYQRQHDEGAFAALVRRHVDLVFGTACRVTGNRASAEEICQNVFLSLARKSAGLQGEGGLAGWLHRAAILESRQHLRGEQRRRLREDNAGQLGTTMVSQESDPSLVEGALDEALLELAERDRRLLLLRYFEGLDFRELGHRHGVSADAAQKRTERALDALTRILQRRGLATVSGTTAAAALQSAALVTAPAHLVPSITAAVAATAGASGAVSGLLFAKLMTLTQVQTSVVCLLLAAVPVGYQWHAAAAAQTQLRLGREQLAAIATRVDHARSLEAAARIKSDASAVTLQTRRAELQRSREQLAASALDNDSALYLWSESSEFVRIPKSVADRLQFAGSIPLPGTVPPQSRRSEAVDSDGTLSATLTEALGVTPEEEVKIERAFLQAKQALEEGARSRAVLTQSAPAEFQPLPQPNWSLITPPLPDGGAGIRGTLRLELTQTLGADRTAVLWQQADRTFIDSFNSLGEYEQVQTVALAGDDQMSQWTGLRKPGGPFTEWGNSSGPLRLQQLPPALREVLAQHLKARSETNHRP